MRGSPLKYNPNPRHLGVWWDMELDFSFHVKIVVGKAWGALNSIRRLCGRMWGVCLKTMRLLYVLLVRPVMEFACCVWDCAPRSAKMLLDKVQRAALLSMTGAPRTTSEEALQAYCFLPSLQDRRDLIQIRSAQRIARLSSSHPIYTVLTDRAHLPSLTHAPSNSFFSRVTALSKRLFRDRFCVLADPSFAESLPLPAFPVSPSFRNPETIDFQSNQVVRVYTDGSAQPNPGPCGSGVLIQEGGCERTLSKFVGIGSNLMAEWHFNLHWRSFSPPK